MKPNNDYRERDADEQVKGRNVTAFIPRPRVQFTLTQAHETPAQPPSDNDPGPSAA